MKRLYATTILISISSSSLFAQGELPTINAGDTAWVLMATGLHRTSMFSTP